jgi:hypothetical protein
MAKKQKIRWATFGTASTSLTKYVKRPWKPRGLQSRKKLSSFGAWWRGVKYSFDMGTSSGVKERHVYSPKRKK